MYADEEVKKHSVALARPSCFQVASGLLKLNGHYLVLTFVVVAACSRSD